MDVTRVDAGAVQLAYETFGDPSHPPLVLVMGLGTQMLGWPEPLCREFAAAGFYVVRFDNRDIGQSTYLDGVESPGLAAIALRRRSAYTVEDMATDTIGLFDGLGFGRVHLVGASMGGFIAQTVALRAPERLSSLTLMMTSTGSRRVGQPRPRVMNAILRAQPLPSREAVINATVEMIRLIASPGYPFDEPAVRAVVSESFDRGTNPAGTRRQLAAVLVQPDRTRALRTLRVPTLVLHGLHDPLVAVSGGLAIARAIPRARFVGFSGMGHDAPQALWPQLVTEITAHARSASG
jgi:pimeloyl-ACP methyl ester carboxylesterase